MKRTWISQNLDGNESIYFETHYWLPGIMIQCVIPYVFLFSFIPWLRYKKSEFVVTSKRVVIKKGIIGRHVTEIPLEKVTNTRLDQGVFGRLFGYGNVEIESAARDGDLKLIGVSKPKDFKSAIARATEYSQDEKVRVQAEMLASAIAAKQASQAEALAAVLKYKG